MVYILCSIVVKGGCLACACSCCCGQDTIYDNSLSLDCVVYSKLAVVVDSGAR